ncbi:MAG: hypothetical protein JXR25_12610 [Pontiellaceae bacterium]|nr:hypothetical protein [Pontiellaceae bacterium]MBN2785658.1 hypothetical protein [Pontiellaceae bacterium]
MAKSNKVGVYSLRNLGVAAQARIAMVLLSLVPALVCFYAGILVADPDSELVHPVSLIVIICSTLTVGIAGWLILRKHARNISRLRDYVVNIAAGSIPDSIRLYQSSDSSEIQCIEDGLNLILNQMNRRIRVIEHKLKLEGNLRRALEKQQQDLLNAERQRVMLQSVGAACHHLGQPATALRMRLYLLRNRAESMEHMEEIDDSLKDLDAIDVILTRLREVNEYRTVPYISSSASDDAEILAI